ncbi:MAG: hypothetical protein HY718_08735 [Planctomycetes bacterium]|nr:hypothetical protein [Planctomycetota bacterium]
MRPAPVILGVLVPVTLLAAPAPRLDGFLTDPFWWDQARAWTLHDPGLPGTTVRCYLGYDDQYLYFAGDVWDTNVVGMNRTPKSKAWEDDAVKLLLHVGDRRATSWTAETFSYTFSAMGGATWCRGPLSTGTAAGVEPGWPPTWNSGVTWAVGLKPGTTPNATGQPDAGYVVEARIPWSELGAKPPFKPGTTMGVCFVNLCRPEMSIAGGKPLSSLAATRQLTPLKPSLWQRVRSDWQGPLPIRGLVEPLPLWLGSPDPQYEAFKTAEADSRGPWLDRSQWTARLAHMRSQNLNTLLLRHANPLRGLLEGAEGQISDTQLTTSAPAALAKAGWFSSSEFVRHRDQFRWVLAEAARNGIAVHLLLDGGDAPNAVDPCRPGSQPATAPAASRVAPTVGEAPVDGPAIARAVARLFDTYPDLAGLAAGPRFNTPVTLKHLVAGFSSTRGGKPAASEPAGARVPGLLIWTDGIQPQLASDIIDRYPNVTLLHPLQGGQWFKPLVDARAAWFALQTEQLRKEFGADPVPGVAVGTLRGASSYLFWGDPQWMRTLLVDVRNQGLSGFLLDVGPGEHSLAREAMADYAYNMGRQYSPQRWESRMRVFGVGDYAGQLLETVQRASAVMPGLLLLLHGDSGRFMPQFGMLLQHYVEMPSYSPSAGGEGPADDRGRLMPALAPVWPEAMWGRSVATLRSEADHSAPGDAIAAWQLTSDIGRHVDACTSALANLRHLTPQDGTQARTLTALLDSIELTVLVGDHVRYKLQAAMGWEQLKARRGRTVDVTQPLQKSVAAWRKAADVADRLYPEPIPFWQSQPVSPPPWSLEYLHRAYIPVRGGWRGQLRMMEREFDLVQQSLSAGGAAAGLPLWDHLNAAPSEQRQTRFIIDFEKLPDPRFRLLEGASITYDPAQRITGKGSALIDTRAMPPGRHEVLTTDVGLIPLVSAQRYQVLLAYRVINSGTPATVDGSDEPFEIGIRGGRDDPPLGDHRCWTAPNGYLGSRILQVPPPSKDGNTFYVATRRPSAIVIDQIQIAQISP